MSASTLAFFSDPHSLLGDAPRRPRSLMSDAALDWLGITVHRVGAELELPPDEEAAQIVAYDFIHAAPIPEVKNLVARGGWRELVAGAAVSLPSVALFREMRDAYARDIAASEYRVRPKEAERKAIEELPADLVYPSLIAIRLRRIAEETGWAREFILWHLPLPEALQILWSSQLTAGRWTIAPAGPEEATPEDLTPGFLAESPQPPAPPLTPIDTPPGS